ncbi:hypothetical protein BU204_37565 [Actinophytocola xanthii]|uniref:Uncharacterized protein n=1 Tax=Actinophytocola xanthii TaxID=1912961 RepID=A0A1Q8BRZ2_9PSEU|nr:hypothetical protein BU204_37565 [Actinophytocola xanthii]
MAPAGSVVAGVSPAPGISGTEDDGGVAEGMDGDPPPPPPLPVPPPGVAGGPPYCVEEDWVGPGWDAVCWGWRGWPNAFSYSARYPFNSS